MALQGMNRSHPENNSLMKTLILNPPWAKEGFYGVRAGSRWPHLESCDTTDYMPFPFFMAYAAAVLERAEKPVAVIDACAEKLDGERCLSRITENQPDLIVIETATPTADMDISYAAKIKMRHPKVLIAFCGPHVMMQNPEFLESQAHLDFVFRGEYETILLEVVTALEQGSDFTEIQGLIYRTRDGSIRDNGSRSVLTDVDTLPWPARHLFKMDLYSDRPGGIPTPSLQMWASRGCPYQCIFCVWPQVMYGGNKYRVRNPTDVIDELEHCLNTWPFKSFYFDDDTFNVGKSRMLALSAEIKSRRIDLPWGVMARADLVDREVLTAMKQAGMASIKYGMESGVQDLIDASGKNLKIEDVEKAVRLSKELGIEVHLTFTFGLPGETEETIRKTIQKAIELDPFSVQFSIATPFPGTTYFEQLKERGHILSENWEEYSGSTGAVHRTEELTKEDLDRALSEAYAVWDIHRLTSTQRFPRLIAQGIRHPKRAFAALKKVLAYHIRLR
jgi:anaerobic magnesium-protoporphyrin IX monomethyl ester cyclase